jgi:hypothetical protein
MDAGYPWLPESVIQGLPQSVGCNTQMGVEIGRESKAQGTLCLLISLVPSRNGIQVSLGGGTTGVGLIVAPETCLNSLMDLKKSPIVCCQVRKLAPEKTGTLLIPLLEDIVSEVFL